MFINVINPHTRRLIFLESVSATNIEHTAGITYLNASGRCNTMCISVTHSFDGPKSPGLVSAPAKHKSNVIDVAAITANIYFLIDRSINPV